MNKTSYNILIKENKLDESGFKWIEIEIIGIFSSQILIRERSKLKHISILLHKEGEQKLGSEVENLNSTENGETWGKYNH